MDQITVMFRLDRVTLDALRKIARDEGSDIGALVREALRRDLDRRGRSKKADRPDERLVAPLRALLAQDIAQATGWDDLQARLAARGYRFVEAGAGLELVEAGTARSHGDIATEARGG